MKSIIASQILTIALLTFANVLFAKESTLDSGDVRVPLVDYQAMLEQLRNQPKPPPAAYAIGSSTIVVDIQDHESRTSSTVRVETSIQTYEDEWTLVPILPHGAALTKITIDGKPAQLVQDTEWLSWGTKKAGIVKVVLQYNIDAMRSTDGFMLPVPIPRAAATQLTINHPGDNPDIAIIPAADIRTTSHKRTTITKASVPTSSSILISWRIPSEQDYIISRANYQGKLQGDAIVWQSTFNVEIFSGEMININLLPSTVTLNSVTVNKKPATIKEKNGQFVALFKGRGKHTVEVGFQVSINKQNGPPQVTVNMPRVPVTRFDLTLPGNKEIKVSPTTNVETKINKSSTVATVYSPMNNTVSFSWIDAVPSDSKVQVRANANVYHSIHAEEGVLHARGIIVYDITHGETNTLSFTVPNSAQVNQVRSATGAISDWIVEKSKQKDSKLITVFLNRKIKGEFTLDVSYEQLTSTLRETAAAIPLLKAANMHRQRGMIALIAGPELALKPDNETNVIKVGENQLPAFVRNQITMTVAHTYKYTNDSPSITVTSVAPERKQGKFDAQADTLISLGEVTMKGSASVQIEIKSGSILDLDMNIPSDVNVLNVAGPSIRTHTVKTTANHQQIHIEFTQEMQGQFRININYEKILGDDKAELEVPTVSITSAEVEHGRIAVEALTAVEVKASLTRQLSTLDINELPQQLVLKTSNPILLAFKYVNAEPPKKLVLQMTRHKELDVQVASIENATYQTLVTNDGLAVTTARFKVLNSRQQFLRLVLPPKTQVWSVFVNNQAEKPANPSEPGMDDNVVLIKMINSSTGFQVELVYATQISKMGMFGKISTHLPQPDMVVTKTHWDLFMPIGPNYHSVTSNMDTVIFGTLSNPQQLASERKSQSIVQQQQAMQPLRVNVPTEGVHFAFKKLYANQSNESANITIHYASADGNKLGIILSIIGVLLIWLVIFMLRNNSKISRQITMIILVVGAIALIISLGYLNTSATYAANLALLGGLLYLTVLLIPSVKKRLANRSEK